MNGPANLQYRWLGSTVSSEKQTIERRQIFYLGQGGKYFTKGKVVQRESYSCKNRLFTDREKMFLIQKIWQSTEKNLDLGILSLQQ